LPKKPKEPAHIIALRELDRIKKEKIWQQGKTKQYYSEVTETLGNTLKTVLRFRPWNKHRMKPLKVSGDKRDLLKDKTFENLSQILKLADLVKFAKYQTSPDDDNMTLVNAYFL
jgi:hypothetical protein